MKLGIIGNGLIVNTLLETVSCAENIEFVSICVRPESSLKGKALSKKYGIKNVYTNTDEFLEDKQIDTVYVGIINTLHYEYAKKALLAGKNVICEKPFTMTLCETEELFRVAEEKGVYLFEAITTIHTPMYKKVKEHLDKVGQVRIINCSFCQYSSRYDKYLEGEIAPVFRKELFGGALVDLNIYNIHFTVSLYGEPERVIYFPNVGKNGVDISGILVLDYGSFKAVCVASKDSASESFGIVQGEKGYIKIASSLNNCEECIISGKDCEGFFKPKENYGRMYYEMVEFDRIISERDGKKYSELKSESLLAMKVLEKAYNCIK